MQEKAVDEMREMTAVMEEARLQPLSSSPSSSLHPPHVRRMGTTIQVVLLTPKSEGNAHTSPENTISFCMKQLKKPLAQDLG